MSLVLLLLVTLTTLARVELAASSDMSQDRAARENAQFALQQALSELQRLAGPDRRTTARAEILGEEFVAGGNRYWTGVWASDQPAAQPNWLVSGESPLPSMLATDAVTLVPAHVSANIPAVRADTVSLNRGDGREHRIAWWVGGEAVKASLDAGRREHPTLIDREKQMLANQALAGVDLEQLIDASANADAQVLSDLSRLDELGALPLLRDSNGRQLFSHSDAVAAFHDYTPRAYGVLENAAQGGLKRNLSDDALREPPLVNEAMQAFLTPLTQAPFADLSAALHKEGEAAHALYPIPTEVVLTMGIFQNKQDAKVKVRYHVEVEFWNPYTVPIQFPQEHGDSDDDYLYTNRGIVVYFDNLPKITVEDMTGGTTAPTLRDDLNNFMAYDEGDNRRYIHAWLDFADVEGSNGAPVLLPGEVYRVSAPNPELKPDGLARDFNIVQVSHQGPEWGDSYRWSANRDAIPLDEAWISVKAEHPREGVRIAFVPFTGGDIDYRELEPFFEIRNLRFRDFQFQQQFRVGNDPFSLEQSSYYRIDDRNMVYHYRLASNERDEDSMVDLLTALDPRDPVLDASASYQDREGKTRRVTNFMQPLNTDPKRIYPLGNYFDKRDLFHDEDVRSHEGDFNKLAIYDQPLAEPISVGVMRHAQITDVAPMAVGNRWGDAVNHVFDTYTMSPLTDAGALLNPWLSPVGESQWQETLATNNMLPHADDTAQLWQQGAFSFNSTSVEAWRAVLGAPTTNADAQLADNTFHRLPFHAAATASDTPDRVILEASNEDFSVGSRSLSEGEGDKQMQYLAEGIVAKLQQRGRPFATLQDFVNAGIVEEAIDEVGVTRGFDVDPINENVMAYSNRYLTQGDIMQRLAPLATVRSDTFIIRAYGEASHANDNSTTRAWCEALVRRRTAHLDGTDAMQPAVGFGRRFEVLSFRWLSPEELADVQAPAPVAAY